MADAAKQSEKKPEAPKEPVGYGVVMYSLGGGKFRVESVKVQGGKAEAVGKPEVRDNPRVALGVASIALEQIAAERLR